MSTVVLLFTNFSLQVDDALVNTQNTPTSSQGSSSNTSVGRLVSEGVQVVHASTNLSLQDGDALVLEGLGELDDLGSFRVDGERRHDHVRPVGLIHQLPDQAGPFLLA